MHGGHSFTWFSLIPGLEEKFYPVAGLIVVSLLFVLFSVSASVSLASARKRPGGGLIPGPKLSLQNFFEVVAESLYKLVVGGLGEHDAPRYFPLVGSLFLVIFTSNIMGLIPGVLPPTNSLNTTLALGSTVFIYYNYLGFKEHGVGYIKHFMGPVIALAPLIFVIEIVSNVIRPISLALRLKGNIEGDHMVMGVFNELTPYVIPVIFNGLGLFVSFVQAFVFCLMTMVYISLSTAHDH